MAAEVRMSAIWILVGFIAAWRTEQLLRLFLARRKQVEDREFTLRERHLALQEQRALPSPEIEEVPMDLQQRILGESELWARDQMRSLVQQLYAKHNDWDKVRAEVSAVDAAIVRASYGWSQTSVVS